MVDSLHDTMLDSFYGTVGDGLTELRAHPALLWAIALAVLPVAGFFLWQFEDRRRRRNHALGAMRALIGHSAGHAGRSNELREQWRLFVAAHGNPNQLGWEELAIVLAEEKAAPFVGRLTPNKLLNLAAHFKAAADARKAAEFLTDDALLEAIGADEDRDLVLAVFEATGQLDRLVDRCLQSHWPHAFYCSFAKGFLKMGRERQALDVLERNPLAHWTPDDTAVAFEAHVRLGHSQRAEAMLSRIASALPVKDHAPFYYEMGRRAEDSGKPGLAGKLYALLRHGGVSYQDSAGRFESLKSAVDGPDVETGASTPRPAATLAFFAPRTGCIGGRYDLIAEIGRGGMGIVHEGRDREQNRKVAVKQMRAELKYSPQERSNFLREARIVARLDHPSIVNIRAVLEDGDDIFMIFDFVEGRTLSKLLEEQQRLPLEQAQKIFESICEAVDYAHRNKVLHRDIKPSNVIVGDDGKARIMDFGIAREMKDAASRLSSTGNVGTPVYMAPEQHLGVARRESDVYSMGVTLFELLTGILPFSGPDFLAQKEREMYPAMTSFVPTLPRTADLLMKAVLQPDPKKRISSATEFHELLKDIR